MIYLKMATNGKSIANGIDDVDFRPSVSIISDKVEVPQIKLGELQTKISRINLLEKGEQTFLFSVLVNLTLKRPMVFD